MPINPYNGDDPRRQEWEQRERLRQEVKEAADRQQQLGEQQLRLQEEQNQYLADLAEPERKRDAIRTQAKWKQVEYWLSKAPEEVRKAQRAIQKPEPQFLAPLGGVASFPLLFLAVVMMIFGLLIPLFAAADLGVFWTIALLLVGFGGAAIVVVPFVEQAAKVRQARNEWKYQQARHQQTVDNYLESCRKESEMVDAECPFCRETVKAGAKKCKHCGELL